LPLAEYLETLRALYALEAARGMDFKLERVSAVLERLGDPHKRYPTIHVAGTNGKGSVAAMLHSVYAGAGYRVGLYTSPHLVDFRERVRVGDELIAESDVVELGRRLQADIKSLSVDLTFFELTTAMAFQYFAQQQVDLAVIEVGLGGRLDATNVIEPEVAVITTISRDHEEFLGSDLESIAREKGGIIKQSCPVVLGQMPAAAAMVLENIAADKGVAVRRFGREYAIEGEERLTYRGPTVVWKDLSVGLVGDHQRENAAIALATLETLQTRFPVPEHAIRHGLEGVSWPGRLEIRQGSPTIVLDGAHNEAGVAALLRELPAILGDRRRILLFGVMRDKRWIQMLESLAGFFDGIVVTRPNADRSADIEQIAAVARRFSRTHLEDDPDDALRHAIEFAGKDGIVVITGSLFLIGAVYPHLDHLRNETDFIPRDSVESHR